MAGLWRKRGGAAAFGLTFAFFLGLFLLFGALGVEETLRGWTRIEAAPPVAAAAIFGLLASDAVLPVPSSVTMLASGSLLGAGAGGAVALAGAVVSNLLLFAAGRRLGPGKGAEARPVRPVDYLLLAATRPLPLLAETSALAAGRTAMRPAARAEVSASRGNG
ncbi:hypothetical protein EON79_18030, partial [bacterium]